MKPALDDSIHELLGHYLNELEVHFDADLLSFYGPFEQGSEASFLKIVEELAEDENKKERIFVVLTTGGGSAEVVERYVNILRHHYDDVNFIVPDYAYSAGTIFCMSGDSIHMDYFSVLGPIDPQVKNREGKLVAALGYLDKINDLLTKAEDGVLTNAEFMILKDFDLAELRGYEQAKNLTIALLEKWLANFKFKNWTVHRTDPALIGQAVTEEQKVERAQEIADKLSNNNLWKSHGRPIDIHALKSLRLEIDDYSNNDERRKKIRDYYELLSDYVMNRQFRNFVHTRKYI